MAGWEARNSTDGAGIRCVAVVRGGRGRESELGHDGAKRVTGICGRTCWDRLCRRRFGARDTDNNPMEGECRALVRDDAGGEWLTLRASCEEVGAIGGVLRTALRGDGRMHGRRGPF